MRVHPTGVRRTRDVGAYTNDPERIARNDNMVAINSALQIDLTGQVCSDSIGNQFYSRIGGQVDFLRGASRPAGRQTDYCDFLYRQEWRNFTDYPYAEPGRGSGHLAGSGSLCGDGVRCGLSAWKVHSGAGSSPDREELYEYLKKTKWLRRPQSVNTEALS